MNAGIITMICGRVEDLLSTLEASKYSLLQLSSEVYSYDLDPEDMEDFFFQAAFNPESLVIHLVNPELDLCVCQGTWSNGILALELIEPIDLFEQEQPDSVEV